MVKQVFLALIGLFILTTASAYSDTPLKNYTLQNQEGKPFQLNDIKGSSVLVSFIYTRCPMPNMCPLTMSLNKRVFALWKKKAPSTPLKFLIVTLDPSHDSASTMKAYSQKYGMTDPAFILATGTEQTISNFSSEFNALGFPSNGLISHNSRSVLLGPNLSPIKDYKDNEWKPEDVLNDLKSFSEKKDEKS